MTETALPGVRAAALRLSELRDVTELRVDRATATYRALAGETPVKVRFFAGDEAERPLFRRRFGLLGTALARVSHPGVAHALWFGEEDGELILVTRFASGVPLPAVGAARVLPILRHLADALDAAHAAGLAHGDVRRENVIVGGPGVVLVDFGVAALRESREARPAEDRVGLARLAGQLLGAPPVEAGDMQSCAQVVAAAAGRPGGSQALKPRPPAVAVGEAAAAPTASWPGAATMAIPAPAAAPAIGDGSDLPAQTNALVAETAPRAAKVSHPMVLAAAVNRFVIAGLAVVLAAVVALAVAPFVSPFQAYTVLSGSMAPTIPVGSLIIVQKVRSDELRPGDVITFARPGRTNENVTHRIVAVDRSGASPTFVTKGDANPAPDSWRVVLGGAAGRYVFGVPLLGYAFGILGSAQGRLLLVILPGIGLCCLYLIDMWRPRVVAARQR